ncbi:hypothetical protein PoB_006006300 [Plakobranchus ocellatus]|uniref:Uncharacterized protein n=1 Tax=Plakobranchus ocellatus TaxID=259542 RepID=A0AAV4CNW9_9GAST|nr:hypothetical protein PoB_006006300 [Plakobranchus ocellatus]
MPFESALNSAGTPLSRVRARLPAPWPDGGPERLISPCCGLAIYSSPLEVLLAKFLLRPMTSYRPWYIKSFNSPVQEEMA